MRRSLVWFPFLLIVLVAVGGCGKSTPTQPPSVWQVITQSYELTDWIDSELPGWGYPPDEGYVWLKLNLVVTNTSNSTKTLNWLLDSFDLVLNGNTYSQSLALNDPPGYLDTAYQPKQAKTGFIAFEIPVSADPKAGKLIFDPWEGPTVTFDLKNVPAK